MKKFILLVLILISIGSIEIAWGQNKSFEDQHLIIFKDLVPAADQSDVLKRFGHLLYSASAKTATIVTLFLEKPSQEVENEYAVFEVTSANEGPIEFKAQQIRLREQQGLNVGGGVIMHAGSQIEGRFGNIRVRSEFLHQKHESDGEKGAALFLCAPWLANARHIQRGNVSMLNYKFISDPQYPLVFKLVKSKGYIYLSGRGTVIRKGESPYRFGGNDAVEKRLQLIVSGDPLIREGAALALGYLSSELVDKKKVMEELVKALSDEVPDVRIAVAESLGRLQVKDSLEQMRNALSKEKNSGVKLAIKQAIEDVVREK